MDENPNSVLKAIDTVCCSFLGRKGGALSEVHAFKFLLSRGVNTCGGTILYTAAAPMEYVEHFLSLQNGTPQIRDLRGGSWCRGCIIAKRWRGVADKHLRDLADVDTC